VNGAHGRAPPRIYRRDGGTRGRKFFFLCQAFLSFFKKKEMPLFVIKIKLSKNPYLKIYE